jgi:tetratricopeptide (TPR) repeat protein
MTYDEAYRRAVDLIEPHMRLTGRTAGDRGRRDADLREGIGYLDAALRLAPDNWTAWWVRGKAQQALEHHEAAYESLRRAYGINGGHVEVGREFVAECLETGRAAEGVRVAEALSIREPRNGGLLANLAVAYLINGRLDDANRAADAALRLDGADATTVSVKRRIEDVRAGTMAATLATSGPIKAGLERAEVNNHVVPKSVAVFQAASRG